MNAWNLAIHESFLVFPRSKSVVLNRHFIKSSKGNKSPIYHPWIAEPWRGTSRMGDRGLVFNWMGFRCDMTKCTSRNLAWNRREWFFLTFQNTLRSVGNIRQKSFWGMRVSISCRVLHGDRWVECCAFLCQGGIYSKIWRALARIWERYKSLGARSCWRISSFVSLITREIGRFVLRESLSVSSIPVLFATSKQVPSHRKGGTFTIVCS